MLAIYELTSALSKDVHFSRMSEEAARLVLDHALQLEIELLMPDSSQTTAAFDWARRLRRASAYDCFYLALAESLGCELWTADQRLVNEAAQPWVRSAIQG
jgi:predicted nucleic acid-binding protein